MPLLALVGFKTLAYGGIVIAVHCNLGNCSDSERPATCYRRPRERRFFLLVDIVGSTALAVVSQQIVHPGPLQEPPFPPHASASYGRPV